VILDFRYQVVSLIKDQHQDLEVYQTRYTHYHQYWILILILMLMLMLILMCFY